MSPAPRPQGWIAMCVTALMLAGCAVSGGPSEPPPPPNAEQAAQACQRLQQVLEAETDGFASLRETQTVRPSITIWQTRGIFPTGECEIWEWGSGETNYVCQWEEGGAIRYSQYQPIIAQCLGGDWTLSDQEKRTGRMSRFQGPGSVDVYLMYSKSSNVFTGRWQTRLIVGDDPLLGQ